METEEIKGEESSEVIESNEVTESSEEETEGGVSEDTSVDAVIDEAISTPTEEQ